MNKYFDISKAGWCTPTLLTSLIGLFSIVTLSGQLLTNKDKKKTCTLINHLMFHVFLTIALVSLMYYFCENNKVAVSWWIFAILYIIPFVLSFLYLIYVFYVRAQKEEDPLPIPYNPVHY